MSRQQSDLSLRPELADVVRLARRAVRAIVGAARADDRTTLTSLLHDHLGATATAAAVVEESWPAYEHVNVQAGLDAWLDKPGREHRLVGIVGFQHRQFGLAELLEVGLPDGFGPRPGNVAWVNLDAGPDGVRACVRCALYLVTDSHSGVAQRRFAVLLRAAEEGMGRDRVTVQVVGDEPGAAAQVAEEVRELGVRHNVFRGQVLSFGRDVFGRGSALLRFHRRPQLESGALILPEHTLDAVRRQVVDVARHRDQLIEASQHLKRGVLLYGPPGVGKTHTVRQLVAELTATTVIELTGEALHLIGEACAIARALQPAMVIVEDVDLIAEERGLHGGPHPLLFQLLNEMDGLAEDADVVFVLTTNRADLLEPALAARPGRIDQAVELTLPDAAARRRLFELYRGRLDVDVSRLDDVIARTEGVTASFLKELLRRAAVVAADRQDGARVRVSAEDLDEALEELLDTRHAMTRTLLGGGLADAPAGGLPRPGLAPR